MNPSMTRHLESPVKRLLPGSAIILLSAVLWPPGLNAETAAGYALYRKATALLRCEADGAPALPVLREALSDPSPVVRRTAAHVLARLGDPARELLREALEHKDGEVRRIAYAALSPAWVRDERLVAALSDPDPVTRNWLHHYLARCVPRADQEWARAEDLLARLLEHSDPDVRLRTVAVMSRWESPPVRLSALLEKAENDAARDVRDAVQRALWPFDRPAVPAALRFPGQVLTLVSEQPLPKDGWRFKTEDPGRPGHRQHWFDAGFDDREWDRIAIEQVWGKAGYDGFVGVGWYRKTVPLPEGEYTAAELHFGGVDECAWVWVNGRFAGQHDIGPAGWDAAFSVDITDCVRWGAANQITVRAKNTRMAGGIWRPVHLRLYKIERH